MGGKLIVPPIVQAQNVIYENAVVVQPSDDLQTKYDWLKSADRDAAMGALSATNRRTLILAPGTHTITSAIDFDTDYVDVSSISGNPTDTILTGVLVPHNITQTCDVMSMSNFKMDSTYNSTTNNWNFIINSASGSNSGSVYTNLIVWHQNPFRFGTSRFPVLNSCDEAGLWINCRSTTYGWRPAKDQDFSPTMWNCVSGDSSFGGDQQNDTTGTGIIGGTFYNCVGGDDSFGGCAAFGMDCSSDSRFYNCVAGNNSYAMGKEFAGQAFNCIGGSDSFAGYGTGTDYGVMSGLLVGCICSADSVGSGHTSCSNTGTMRNCNVTAMDSPIMLGSGAVIEHCRIEQVSTGIDAIAITDDTVVPRIFNSTIKVLAAGTGVPVNAGAAQNAYVAHCRMNNRDNDADGLGANVTNLCSNGSFNVVENDI